VPIAELYRLLHRGHRGDVDFYVDVCRGVDTVLELGCGYGRVSKALLAAGHSVTGLDNDEAMLALAREEVDGITWVHGDMTSFSLDTEFDRVVVPFNTLCCLLTVEQLESCLVAAHRHLIPNGRLAFDVYRADEMVGGDDDEEQLVAFEHDGVLLDVFERSSWDPADQRLDTHYRFVPRGGGGVVEHTIKQRYLMPDEMHQLLSRVGFEVVLEAGGFVDEPSAPEADHIVVVAQKTKCESR
jgi:SAM-dependent methyltransferase